MRAYGTSDCVSPSPALKSMMTWVPEPPSNRSDPHPRSWVVVALPEERIVSSIAEQLIAAVPAS